MIVHLGHDDAELQAVTVDHEPYGSAWRQRDYDIVTDPDFKRAIQDNHIVVIKFGATFRSSSTNPDPRLGLRSPMGPL